MLSWDTTRENLASREPKSSFAAKIKASITAGQIFYEVTGVIEK